MGICDKRTLQPGGGDPCDDGTLLPPGAEPPGERPFDPPPPPIAGNCNIDDDCPLGYVCVDGVCVVDSRLPGGPNTPIIDPADPNANTGDSGPGGSNQPPFPDGPSGSGSGGCAGEFICLLESPVPDPELGNPKDQVEGGGTLGTDGEGPVYKVPLELCETEEEIPLDPVTCSIDEDCPEGFVCRDGLCVSVECEPACCDILEEGVSAEEFCELREKELDPENGWEVTDRSKEPYEQGYPYPFAGTLGKGKEFFDHSLNCQAQNGQEMWNINDGLQRTSCFLPDKYAQIVWEPQQHVFCRRVDFAEESQTWGDVLIGDLRDYQDGTINFDEIECDGPERLPRDEQTSGRLFVQHATTLYDSLSVKEWTYLNCTLEVKEDITCAGSLTLDGDLTVDDYLYTREKAKIQIWDDEEQAFVLKTGYILFHDLEDEEEEEEEEDDQG